MVVHSWHRRSLALIAVIAIVAAVALLLVPQGHSGSAGAWFAILPALFFVGVIAPLSLLPAVATSEPCRAVDDPQLPASFQRPPPLRRS
jgi:membrane associated rhomboid family serine protease